MKSTATARGFAVRPTHTPCRSAAAGCCCGGKLLVRAGEAVSGAFPDSKRLSSPMRNSTAGADLAENNRATLGPRGDAEPSADISCSELHRSDTDS